MREKEKSSRYEKNNGGSGRKRKNESGEKLGSEPCPGQTRSQIGMQTPRRSQHLPRSHRTVQYFRLTLLSLVCLTTIIHHLV